MPIRSTVAPPVILVMRLPVCLRSEARTIPFIWPVSAAFSDTVLWPEIWASALLPVR